MHRGLVLSDGIRGHFWPWAPAIGRPVLAPAASALSDPVWQFVPWIELARSELRAGRLPLWNPHQEAGQPLLGNGSPRLASPLLWPALALPLFPGWNLSLLLRILVSAAGGWALARDYGRTRAAALLAAVVCSLSGPFVAWLEHPQTLTAAAVPWLLLAVRRSVRAEGAGRIAAVAAATALVLAGGHHETALMAAFLAAGAPRGGGGVPARRRAAGRRRPPRCGPLGAVPPAVPRVPPRGARPGRAPIATWRPPAAGSPPLRPPLAPGLAPDRGGGVPLARGAPSRRPRRDGRPKGTGGRVLSSSSRSSSSRRTTARSRGSSRKGRRSAGAGRSSSSRFPPPSSPRAASTS